jgi:hypothetical protein
MPILISMENDLLGKSVNLLINLFIRSISVIIIISFCTIFTSMYNVHVYLLGMVKKKGSYNQKVDK